jgi:DNA-binding NtrC family response regulator
VVPIHLPPLRERRDDIRDLAQHFLGRFALKNGRPRQSLSDAAAQVLEAYRWPGNIRELENTMERLVCICDSAIIEESDLPLEISVAAGLRQEAERETSLNAAIAAFEKGYLRKVLVQNKWHRRRTAEQLGIGYSTLKVKLKSYGIGPIDGDDD